MKLHAWLKPVSVIALLLCMGLVIANQSGTVTAYQPEPTPTTPPNETTESQDGGVADIGVSTGDDSLSSDGFLQRIIGTQFQGVLAPGETGTWFTWGWSRDQVVAWSLYPTSPGGRLEWSEETELERSSGAGNGLIVYHFTVTNTGSVTTAFEARYSIFR